ncbi:HMA2 domain-containing protein [Peptostreptococcus porci]|uniref:HMA2 domain-containing protein n=1 Tax=Peptostreptococcus porci TaxID=2652282 RepID=UPI002A76637E|nr:cation transporter [Peptostreptococcus porci]MDY2795423.1 cation transporter [Peptostreptococcus porci]MDY4561492.1 cation transporter [Peptostreptococcus porci]MDY5436884.1 cation transporter [Peptostreptococcus porci]
MLNIKASFLKLLFKFEVVSDLPGRLRLKVNNYKRLPKESVEYQSYGIEAIKKLDGIKNVNFNFVIGTILIEYDKYKVDSKTIINWLELIKKLAVENERLINDLSEKSEEEAREIVFKILDINLANIK